MQIQIGNITLVLEPGEDPTTMLQNLLRRLTNQELADFLGVSERTVRRWKMLGRLPGLHARPALLELLQSNPAGLAREPGGGKPPPLPAGEPEVGAVMETGGSR